MVGDKLKAWRDRNGKGGEPLSTRDAAEMAGVSQPVWLAIEKGDSKRTGLDVAMRIASLPGINVSLEEFVAEEHKRRPKARPKPRRRRPSVAPS